MVGPIVLAIGLWLFGRRRWPGWRQGLVAIWVGWGATALASSAIGFLAGPDTDPDVVIGRVVIAGMIVTTVWAFVLARRPVAPPRPPPPFVPERPDRSA